MSEAPLQAHVCTIEITIVVVARSHEEAQRIAAQSLRDDVWSYSDPCNFDLGLLAPNYCPPGWEPSYFVYHEGRGDISLKDAWIMNAPPQTDLKGQEKFAWNG